MNKVINTDIVMLYFICRIKVIQRPANAIKEMIENRYVRLVLIVPPNYTGDHIIKPAE